MSDSLSAAFDAAGVPLVVRGAVIAVVAEELFRRVLAPELERRARDRAELAERGLELVSWQ